jgi:hypothetical protein
MLSVGNYFIVMPNVIMLSAVMLNVVAKLKLQGHLFFLQICYSGFCNSGVIFFQFVVSFSSFSLAWMRCRCRCYKTFFSISNVAIGIFPVILAKVKMIAA